MSIGGAPIPDPDPTGEYPDGWSVIVEGTVEMATDLDAKIGALTGSQVQAMAPRVYEIVLAASSLATEILRTAASDAPSAARRLSGPVPPPVPPRPKPRSFRERWGLW